MHSLSIPIVIVFLHLKSADGLSVSALNIGWQEFVRTHNKTYSAHEELFRYAVWKENVLAINRHNSKADQGVHTYWLSMNEYGDLTNEEYFRLRTGFIMNGNIERSGSIFKYTNLSEYPRQVDWRRKGYVTRVKDQGGCGSCYAFSATGALEGQHFRKTGKLVSLSEQNIVDCSFKEGNKGCKGGLMDKSFTYIKNNNGIDKEEAYPYEARDGPCRFRRSEVGATDRGYVDLPENDETALRHAVATIGPISVAIDGHHFNFRFYDHGVFDNPNCSKTKINHGVLVVGYGTRNGLDYWMVKNSWGRGWGAKGYILMSRNNDNQCCIACAASYPIV
uniref:Cathepsin L n=1 Tax=Cristaria plicata TaxID=165446 RepID=G1EAS0_CRIPL|nr:cathepsin L [Cristaria plicata]AFO67888.1 cathepsin L [Cristaria plicata]